MSEEDEARRLEERRAKGEEGLRGTQGAARQHRQPGQQQDQGEVSNICLFSFINPQESWKLQHQRLHHLECCNIPPSSCPSKPIHPTIWRSLRESIGDSWRGGRGGRAWRTSRLRNCSSRECSGGDAGERGYVHTRVWSRGPLPSCSVLQIWGILLVNPNSTFHIVARYPPLQNIFFEFIMKVRWAGNWKTNPRHKYQTCSATG